MIRRLALTLALVAASTTALATAVVDRSLAAILDAADVVVYGRVAGVQAEETEEAIRTRVLLEVDRDLTADEAPREELELSFLGGRTAAGEVLEVAGVPAFEVGDRVLVAAYGTAEDAVAEAPRLASPIVGVWQGLWRLGPNGLGDERGRLLTPTDDGLAADGVGGDLTEVLDAIAAWRAGEAEIVPAPSAGTPAGTQPPEVPAPPADPGAAAPAPAEAPASPEVGAAGEAARGGDAGASEAGDGDVAPPAEAGAGGEAGADRAVVRLAPPENEALRRTIEAAAAAWRTVGVEVEVRFEEAAEDAIVLGDPARLGPDALALSLRGGDAAGTEVRVDPAAAARTDVLAYELAVLAGAAPTEEGLLSGRFDADAETLPGREDARAFEASLERLPGDLDADGHVDVYDLARLGERFGRTGSRLAGDLNGDGRVGEADLDLLRARYEFLPPAPDPPPGWEGTPD